MWLLCGLVVFTIHVPQQCPANIVLGTLKETSIECASTAELTFKFISRKTNISHSFAECDHSIKSCRILKTGLEDKYNLSYTGLGGNLRITSLDEDTLGAYKCCETYNPNNCVSTEISWHNVFASDDDIDVVPLAVNNETENASDETGTNNTSNNFTIIIVVIAVIAVIVALAIIIKCANADCHIGKVKNEVKTDELELKSLLKPDIPNRSEGGDKSKSNTTEHKIQIEQSDEERMNNSEIKEPLQSLVEPHRLNLPRHQGEDTIKSDRQTLIYQLRQTLQELESVLSTMDTTANISHEEKCIFENLKDDINALELIGHRKNTRIKEYPQCIDITANQATSCDKHEGSRTKVAIQSYNLACQTAVKKVQKSCFKKEKTALKDNTIYNTSFHHIINEVKPCIETLRREIKDDEQNTENAQIIYQNTDMSATNMKEHEQDYINARKTEEKALRSDKTAEGISDYTLRSKHYADTTWHVKNLEEFRRLLITHCTATSTLLNQYTSVGKFEGSSEEIYVNPTLHILQRQLGWNEDELTKVFTTCVAEENKTEINSYKDMFYTGH